MFIGLNLAGSSSDPASIAAHLARSGRNPPSRASLSADWRQPFRSPVSRRCSFFIPIARTQARVRRAPPQAVNSYQASSASKPSRQSLPVLGPYRRPTACSRLRRLLKPSIMMSAVGTIGAGQFITGAVSRNSTFLSERPVSGRDYYLCTELLSRE
jgi:hypothetical protein